MLLEQVRNYVLPALEKHGPVVAWIVDDTGFPKKGKHSVGVARQYCGQVGKQDNCRVAVSLSVATWSSSLPIAYRLYLPKEWAEDAERRDKTEVPARVEFQTKPEIVSWSSIRAAVAAKVPPRGSFWPTRAYGNQHRIPRRTHQTRTGICCGACKAQRDSLGTGQTAFASEAARKNGPALRDSCSEPRTINPSP